MTHPISRPRLTACLLAVVTMLVTVSFAAAASASTPAPLAQFNRETNAYASTLTTQQEANRYQEMTLQSTDHAQVPLLKAANPNLKIFMYVDTIDSRPSDSLGWTTCTDYPTDNASHPSWFLLDQNGNRIQNNSYPGNYLMDVGNPAYQQACISHAISLAKQYGFDGVFFDNVTANLGWDLASTVTVPAYPTSAAWQSAEYSLLTYAGPQIHSQGLQVIANIGGGSNVAGIWQKWTTPLDGSEEESWTDTNNNVYWPQQIADAAWSAANGKIAILHSHNVSETANTYGLASMLLVTQGNESYSTANANYTTSENWFPEYQTAQSLGAPISASTQLTGGVYARAFANGVVLVNPSGSTQSVGLGLGTYSGSGLSSVSSATLGPWGGLILLNDNPGISVAPRDVITPGVSGQPMLGQTLTANSGVWTGSPTYSLQWMRCPSTGPAGCSAIPGATGSTYTVQPADAGQYITLTVSGANGGGSGSASSAATAQVPAPTFTLAVSTASQTITHGGAAYYTISVKPKNGFTGSVALSVTGQPSPGRAWFSPATTSSWSSFGVATTATTPPGTYTLTVTGTGGGVTSTVPLTLKVN